VTVTQGTNTVVGSDPQWIVAEALVVLDGKGKGGKVPELWDGKAAERVVQVMASFCPPAPPHLGSSAQVGMVRQRNELCG